MQRVNGRTIIISKDAGEARQVAVASGRIIWIAKGIAGKSAEIVGVEAVTLPAGEPATVENIGTTLQAFFKFGIPSGKNGKDGKDGEDGNGIVSIYKTGTSGLVDTYTILYDNGDTDEFTVTNGATGNGIQSITKTGSTGNVDHYRITFTDGTHYDYDVTNGASTWGSISGNLSDQTDLQNALDGKLDAPYTQSGAIVQFEAESDHAIKGITAQIVPVQNLNGQSAPYPAGGGKNKTATATVQMTTNTYVDSEITVGNVSSTWVLSFDMSNADYSNASAGLLNFIDEGTNHYITPGTIFRVSDGKSMTNIHSLGQTLSGRFYTTYTGKFDTLRWYYMSSSYGSWTGGNITNIQLEENSTPTAYAPYANICPITGYSNVVVTRTGKNLFDKSATDADNGYVADYYLFATGALNSGADWRVSEYIRISPNNTYSLSGLTGNSPAICFYDKFKTFIPSGTQYSNNTQISVTTPANAYYTRLSYKTTNADDVQLELGSTASTYESYQGTSVTVALGDTRYGGSVDLTSGVLTVDRAYAQIDPINITQSVNIYVYEKSDMKSGNGMSGLCNMFPTVTSSASFGIRFGANNNNIYFYKLGENIPSIVDTDTCKAWFTANPTYIVYPLATPVTVQLTPTQLSSLIGTNVLYANSGDISVLIYKAVGNLAFQDTVDYETQVTNKPDLSEKADIIITSASGNIATIEDGAPYPVTALSVGIEPVQAGSGDPAPDNIRPITGRTSVYIERTGKNLFAGYEQKSYLKSGQHVVFSSDTLTGGKRIRLQCFDSNDQAITPTMTDGLYFYMSGTTVVLASDKTALEGGFTLWHPDLAYIKAIDDTNTGYHYPMYSNIQMEYGSTVTPYQPYSGVQIAIPLGQTVYGGTLDLLTGEMVLTWAKHSFADDTWTYYDHRFNIITAIPDAKGGNNADCLCSCYKSNAGASTRTSDVSICFANNGYVYVYDTTFTGDENAFKAFMADKDFIYELATPLSIQLTPSTLSLLKGSNRIWASSGDVNVGYKADTKLFIEQLTKPTEDDMTANTNIASGKYFMVGNSLFKSTASIATGDKIIVGTNCTALSLADALNQLA